MYVYSLKQNSLQGESQGQRSLAGLGLIRGAYSPWGRKELDMTEATACMQAHTHTHTHMKREMTYLLMYACIVL